MTKFLASSENASYKIVFRNLSLEIKEAVKNGQLSTILPRGYYGAKDGVIDENPEIKPSNGKRGLIQDFVIFNEKEFETWFLSEKANNPFLIDKKIKVEKEIKDPVMMTEAEALEAFEKYREELLRKPKPRVKKS